MYQVTLMDGVAANADLTTAATILEYPYGENGVKLTCTKGNLSMEVVSTSNGTTGVVKLQHSDNGTTFKDVDNGSIALTAAGTYTLLMTSVMKKYYIVVYTKGDGSTGIVTTTLTFS